MRRLSSYIHNNFKSPDRKDIENARRRREIEKIDQNLQLKNQRSSQGMELKNDEYIDIDLKHNSRVNKLEFRKSHSYQR